MKFEKNYKLNNTKLKVSYIDSTFKITGINNNFFDYFEQKDFIYSQRDDKFYIYDTGEGIENILNDFLKSFNLDPALYHLEYIEKIKLYYAQSFKQDYFSIYKITDKEDFAFGLGIPWNIIRPIDVLNETEDVRYLYNPRMDVVVKMFLVQGLFNEDNKIADNSYILADISSAFYEHNKVILLNDLYTSSRKIIDWKKDITLDENMCYTINTGWKPSAALKKYLHNYITKYILKG